jgi:hypothetical protein
VASKLPDIPIAEWLAERRAAFDQLAEGLVGAFEFRTSTPEPDEVIPADFLRPGGVDPQQELDRLLAEEARLAAERAGPAGTTSDDEGRASDGRGGGAGQGSALTGHDAGGESGQAASGQAPANPQVAAFLGRAAQVERAAGLTHPDVEGV